MATLKELMGDKNRGDGRKFQDQYMDNDEWFEPIFLTDVDDGSQNDWHGLDERGYGQWYESCVERYWKEYTPPKQTKKVKLYSPIGLKDNGKIYTIGQYANEKSVFNSGSDKIIGWHEIEVEVDE
jgi:hypothetical protein